MLSECSVMYSLASCCFSNFIFSKLKLLPREPGLMAIFSFMDSNCIIQRAGRNKTKNYIFKSFTFKVLFYNKKEVGSVELLENCYFKNARVK